MALKKFTIEISPQRTDCFILLPSSYTDHELVLHDSASALKHMFVPVEIIVINKFTKPKKVKNSNKNDGFAGHVASFNSWITASTSSMSSSEGHSAAEEFGGTSSPRTPNSSSSPISRIFVGALTASPQSRSVKENRLQIGPQFALDLGLNEGDIVSCQPAIPQQEWRVAIKLDVSPLDVNESEVVEKYALTLQNTLMQTLRVLFPGQVVTLRTPNNMKAKVRVSQGSLLEPEGAACYVLTDGSEVHVACIVRKTSKDLMFDENAPKQAILRLALPKETVNKATLSRWLRNTGGFSKVSQNSHIKSLPYPALVVDPETAFLYKWAAGTSVGVINLVAFARESGELEGGKKDGNVVKDDQKQIQHSQSGGLSTTRPFSKVDSPTMATRKIERDAKEHEEKGGLLTAKFVKKYGTLCSVVIADSASELVGALVAGGSYYGKRNANGVCDNTKLKKNSRVWEESLLGVSFSQGVGKNGAQPAAADRPLALIPDLGYFNDDAYEGINVHWTSMAVRGFPTNIYVIPSPGDQYRQAPLEVLSLGYDSSTLSSESKSMGASAKETYLNMPEPCRTLGISDVEAVHGTELGMELVRVLRPHACPRLGVTMMGSRNKKEAGNSEVYNNSEKERQYNDMNFNNMENMSNSENTTGFALNSNVLLCGPSGSGVSTIACVAARYSGRHVVFVDVAAVSLNKLKTVIQDALAECNFCSPSILILDDLSAIASSVPAGPGQAPTSMTAGTERLIHEWLLAPTKENPLLFNVNANAFSSSSFSHSPSSADVIVLATARNFDELHPQIKLPSCFSVVIKVAPSLSSSQKSSLMKQQLTRFLQRGTGVLSSSLTGESAQTTDFVARARITALADRAVDILTSMMENYSAFDITALCAKVARYISSRLFTESLERIVSKESLSRIIHTFVPRSRAGIKFLGGGGARQGGSEGMRRPSWNDAGGLREAKAALHDILVLPAKYPQIFSKLPLKAKSGVLLTGPSGCGKTYLVQVVVAAENLHCIVVNGPEIFGKYIGTSEQKIREIFESAQAAAPCVVFFDSFESVAPTRGNSNTGVTDRVVNQLLCYLDGVEGRKDVYVVAATSRPDMIDPALMRPGRLDSTVKCPMPSLEDRVEVLLVHLRKMLAPREKLGLSDKEVKEIAGKAEGWTCADIAGLVAQAHNTLMQEFLKVTSDDLLRGITVETNAAENNGTESGRDVFSVFVGGEQSQVKGGLEDGINDGNDNKNNNNNNISFSFPEASFSPSGKQSSRRGKEDTEQVALLRKHRESVARSELFCPGILEEGCDGSERFASLHSTATPKRGKQGDGLTSSPINVASAAKKAPRLTKVLLEAAMAQFTRSRESQNAGKSAGQKKRKDMGADTTQQELMQLAQLLRKTGTRETSA